MKRLFTILVLTALIASCAPLTTAPESTITAEQSAAPAGTSTATAIPKPGTIVKGRAILSQWPDEAPCASQNIIPEGSQVTLDSTYKDFVAVEIQLNGDLVKGFLPKTSLEVVPADLAELSDAQVPWKPVVDYSTWSYYSAENGGELIISPASDNESDVVTDPSDHPVPVPLRIHFGLQETSNSWAEVKIFGLLDNHDPWWKDTTRMDVFVNGTTYELCVRDGSTENCSADIILNLSQDQEITFLFLDSHGKHLQILDNNEKVVQDIDFTSYPGLHLPDGLFPEGVFHFGTSVGAPGTLKVTHLSISTVPSGIYEASWMSEPGLAELAAPEGIMIGSAFNPDNMLDDRYCKVIRHDFNLGALSVFTDANIWLGPNQYNFALLDQQVNDSAQYGITILASHLVWGSYDDGVLPDWLKNGNYSKEELLNILHNHITTLVTRYKDKVKIWSIANEAPERDRYYGADFWFDHIGSEYITKAFQWAHEADPNAILLLNSSNNESPRDADTTYNIETLYKMVKTMKENGIPIDAVGMQSHLFLPWTSHIRPQEADVVATMKRFGDLGVIVMITEMDVNLHEIPGTAQEKEEAQQQLYSTMMTACLHSGVCTLFATWGVYDGESWITFNNSQWIYQYPVPDAEPLLFDSNFDPKSAYFAVLDELKGDTPAPIATALTTDAPTAPTITPTTVTYLPGLSINVPEPDSAFIENVVSENYLSVMGLKRDQVVLTYKEHTGIDGQLYVVMVDTSTGVPLAIYTERKWQEATLKFFGRQDGFMMGVSTPGNYTDQDLKILSQFSSATIENGNEWWNTELKRGEYNLDYAQQPADEMKVLRTLGITNFIGHPLTTAGHAPWIDESFTKDELREIMKARVRFFMDHNVGAGFIVVVNEPNLIGPALEGRQEDVFFKAWGNSDYVVEYFETAREINPKVKLIFNDTDNHRRDGGLTKSTQEVVGILHEKGLVDYVGMEMHLNQWCGVQDGIVDTDTILEQIEYYRNLGLPVLFTEVTYEPTEAELALDEKAFNTRLAQIFRQVIQVAIKSGNVKGITFWGTSDKDLQGVNWYQIFDKFGQKKESYYEVLKVLYENIP